MCHRTVRSFGLMVLTLAAFVGRSQGADDEAIQHAVNRGVDFLRGQQRNGAWGFDGSGTAQGHPTGPGITSLAAIALLECGVGPDDPAIQSAARYVRLAVTDCDYTYSISAAIMFLDRLGQNEDIPRIELLTVRLLSGQAMDGTWGYTCPKVGEKELHRIRTA